MHNISEVIDVTGYPLIPLEKNAEGHYPFPRTRYGILPYHIDHTDQIIWGCIESNRVEPITLSPAAGTQDIIAIRGNQRLVLESGKPLPDINIDGVLKGERFRDQTYQETIECLIINGFSVYLENPLATAVHEAYEEHGIDLRKINGRDMHLLNTPVESSPHILIPGQGNVAPLCVWLPELTNCDGIILRHTNKTDTKMRRNFGRQFYEQGCWVTLENFRTKLHQEKARFSSLDQYTPVKVELITEALNAFELHLQFLERLELSIPAKHNQIENDRLAEIRSNPHAFFSQTRGAIEQDLSGGTSTAHLQPHQF